MDNRTMAQVARTTTRDRTELANHNDTFSNIVNEIKNLKTHCDLNSMLKMFRELNQRLAQCDNHIFECETFYNIILNYV